MVTGSLSAGTPATPKVALAHNLDDGAQATAAKRILLLIRDARIPLSVLIPIPELSVLADTEHRSNTSIIN